MYFCDTSIRCKKAAGESDVSKRWDTTCFSTSRQVLSKFEFACSFPLVRNGMLRYRNAQYGNFCPKNKTKIRTQVKIRTKIFSKTPTFKQRANLRNKDNITTLPIALINHLLTKRLKRFSKLLAGGNASGHKRSAWPFGKAYSTAIAL